jgi:hypothetical protein
VTLVRLNSVRQWGWIVPKWSVTVSYWCGFTGDRDWQERVRGAMEARGWTVVRFGNRHDPDYVPFSSNVDGDEILFVAAAGPLDRKTVESVLAPLGIEHTAYVTIEECKAE